MSEALVAPLSGALVARVGPRRLMVAGIVAVAAAFAWLSAAEPGAGYVDAILPGVLLYGLGLGLAVTPLTAAALAAVADPDLGEAAAVRLRRPRRASRLAPPAPRHGYVPPIPDREPAS